jgi:hypothetical protein
MKLAQEIRDAVVQELDGRSVFNGIDEDILEEIAEELEAIIQEKLDNAKA